MANSAALSRPDEGRPVAPGGPVGGSPVPPAKKAASHRLRFLLGVGIGSLIAVGLSYSLLSQAREDAVTARHQRKAVVSVLALADLVVRTGEDGEAIRKAVSAWREQAPAGSQARVILFNGLSLEASTHPGEDAPRRLKREEKELYDQGQRLRAAVETNREEGVARKEEIEIVPLVGGSSRLAAPLEREGAVIGLVEVQTPTAGVAPKPNVLFALLAVLGPVALLGILALLLGERRNALAAIALGGLALGTSLYAWHSISTVVGDRRAAQEEVADYVRTQAQTAQGLLTQLNLPLDPPIVASRWDANVFRQPRQLLTAEGKTDEGALGSQLALASSDATRALVGVGILALLVMLAIGFGAVARLFSTFISNRQAYAYVAPALLGMLVLVFFPFFYGITLSFTDSNLYNTSKPLTDLWVGLRNYVDILSDFEISRSTPEGGRVVNYFNFYWTLWVTVIWTITNVIIGVTGGLILALLLNTKNLALRPIYRVVLILPWAMPNYITSLIWKGMFHQQFGVVNHVIAIFGGSPVSWFESPFTSFLTALTTNGWLSFPFMMVTSLGALQSIPIELYEAARVDGASKWQQFRSITLPSLKPALVPAIILSVVWTFNQFNVIYLVTAGEPGGSTEILITQAYKFAFEKYRYGYAAAYSTVIFGILLVYGTFQNRVTKATEAN